MSEITKVSFKIKLNKRAGAPEDTEVILSLSVDGEEVLGTSHFVPDGGSVEYRDIELNTASFLKWILAQTG